MKNIKENFVMYLNPFWAGVLATIFAELSTMFIASVIIIFRRAGK